MENPPVSPLPHSARGFPQCSGFRSPDVVRRLFGAELGASEMDTADITETQIIEAIRRLYTEIAALREERDTALAEVKRLRSQIDNRATSVAS